MRLLSVVLCHFFAMIMATGQTGSVPLILDFETFKHHLSRSNDTTYVINFWATWCKPCVEELPYFERINAEYADQPVKVLLVSMDFKNQLEQKLMPFIDKQALTSEVVVLFAPDANAWIDQVDEEWTGALPATLIYRNDQRKFHGEQFESYDQLNNIIKSLN